MPTIVSPYQASSPLGETIGKVAAELFGGDKVAPALNREKLRAAQRQNAETVNLMSALGGNDIDWKSVGPALIGSGYDPQNLNEFARGRAAALYGARDPRTQAAQIGAGGPFSATADAFDASQATERRGQDLSSADRRYNIDRDFAATTRGQDITDARGRYEFDNKPLQATRDGSPVFVRQSDAFDDGISPILKDGATIPRKFEGYRDIYLRVHPGDEKGADDFALGQSAHAKGMKITGPDGFSVEMGGGVGDLTNSNRTSEQGRALASNRFLGLIDTARELTKDPTLFGVTGQARAYGQDVVQLLNNIAQITGAENTNQLLDTARQDIAKSGVTLLPELYDPNVPAVETIWGLLTYAGASALAGQDGRNVSDKDVAQFKTIVGNPNSVFASAPAMRAKLDILERLVHSNDQTGRAALAGAPLPERGGPQAPLAPPAPAQAPGAAAPSVDHAASLDEARRAIGRGAPRDAVIQRLQAAGIDPGGL